MAKVTYFPRTIRPPMAKLEDRGQMVFPVFGSPFKHDVRFDWRQDIEQYLAAQNWRRVTNWERSGRNYTAEFENARIYEAFSPQMNETRFVHYRQGPRLVKQR